MLSLIKVLRHFYLILFQALFYLIDFNYYYVLTYLKFFFFYILTFKKKFCHTYTLTIVKYIIIINIFGTIFRYLLNYFNFIYFFFFVLWLLLCKYVYLYNLESLHSCINIFCNYVLYSDTDTTKSYSILLRSLVFIVKKIPTVCA